MGAGVQAEPGAGEDGGPLCGGRTAGRHLGPKNNGQRIHEVQRSEIENKLNKFFIVLGSDSLNTEQLRASADAAVLLVKAFGACGIGRKVIYFFQN